MKRALRLPAESILKCTPVSSQTRGEVIGHSRQGRPLFGFRFGSGGISVSLLGGCHADEPVGPAMLRLLTSFLDGLPASHPLLQQVKWLLVPHVNPDGEERNRFWSEALVPVADHADREDQAYALVEYLRRVVREEPGDDLEFGFPVDDNDSLARPETRAVADFLAPAAPFHLHGSFHGMGFATGPWFLLEAAWRQRTAAMRHRLRARVKELGYRPFDVDRRGEKGFHRIDEGFSTRPDSAAMKAYFLDRGDEEMAALFRPSSMEYVRSLGGDPLTFVSEMPLFLVLPGAHADGVGAVPDLATLEGRQELRRRLEESLDDETGGAVLDRGWRVEPMPLGDQMRLQLALLEESLSTVAAELNFEETIC